MKLIDHSNSDTAFELMQLFHASYAIEAQLLKAVDFPPLKRKLNEFIDSENDFYGYLKNDELAGAVEIRHHKEYIHLQSLVVNPDHFRQGIAGKMMDFILQQFGDERLLVETGVDNLPAKNLYLKYGFELIHEWDTDHGVRKIRLERKSV
jgi:ribosomal protein S18 acetylase RimI-like enzyme